MTKTRSWNDLSVLVCGAGRGIGRAVALAAAAKGAQVLAVSRSADPLKRLLDALPGKGHESLTTDLCSSVGRRDLLNWLEKRETVDVVVACAHTRAKDRLTVHMGEEVDDIDIGRNLRYLFALQSALLPRQRRAGFGRWIAIGSCSHVMGLRGRSQYNAEKAALEAMMRTLANEQGLHGITANTVLPGFIDTDATSAIPAEIRAIYAEGNALARPGRPEEVAHAVILLADPMAAYITGTCLQVNGGSHLGLERRMTRETKPARDNQNDEQ
jgi:NAD(P)-dependent dehydrogenase (short-subunit alcohol dehydrogenase family)